MTVDSFLLWVKLLKFMSLENAFGDLNQATEFWLRVTNAFCKAYGFLTETKLAYDVLMQDFICCTQSSSWGFKVL